MVTKSPKTKYSAKARISESLTIEKYIIRTEIKRAKGNNY
jgi:hypothetical protein